MKKALIIDSSYLIYKSYFGYPNLTSNLKNTAFLNRLELPDEQTLQNFPLGAVFGFVKTVFYLVKDIKPTDLIFTFDLKEKTWRHDLKQDYKDGRAKPESNMVLQIPLIQKWTNKITKNNFSTPGFEADDWIFTASKNFLKNSEDRVLIFSADRDLYQILTDNRVSFVKTNKFGQLDFFGLNQFVQKYNLKPSQWLDFKAIVGDPSDNLTGIKGIGEKTAVKILNIFGSLRNLFFSQGLILDNFLDNDVEYKPEMLDSFKKESSKYQNFLLEIVDKKKLVLENYKLAKLSYVQDVEIISGFDFESGMQDLKEYNFNSLINFYSKNFNSDNQQKNIQDTLF
jgi:DNA polymerase-1